MPIQHVAFINTSTSIPEPMKHFDGLDRSYTFEKYSQQVEARLTFAIGEEPQNNPVVRIIFFVVRFFKVGSI